MANYNKSFNFRNGVQVDEDKFLVRNNLVGIGTTVPTADLDVRGTLKSIGIITAKDVFVTGVATFSNVRIGTGITIDGNAGIISAKFFGDGAGLFNIPTSQWVDVDPAVFPGVGVGYSSIYAAGTVGIGTTVPRSFLQVGGDPNLGQNGVGVNSTGGIRASGIVTASSFVGSGASLTTLNASNISSGTLDNSRLPSNISVGFVTATTFSGSLTGTATTAQGLTGTPNITVGTIDGSSLNISGLSTFAGITTVTGTTLFSKQLNVSGIATVTQLSDYKALVGAASSVTETFVVTVTSKTANHRYFGTGSASGYYIDGRESPFITLLPGKTYRFDQADGSNASHQLRFYLEADKTTQYTTNVTFNGTAGGAGAYTEIIVTDTTPIVLHYQCVNHGYMGNSVQTNSNFINTPYSINTLGGLSVSGISTFAGITTVTGTTLFSKQLNVSGVATVGILTATQATIGVLTSTSSKSGSIQLGVTATNQVDTTSGNLVLDSAGGLVDINDNIDVSGTSTLSGEVTVDTGIVPDTSTGAYLGQNTRQFSEAWIGDLKIAVGVGNSNKIETISQELVLDSVVNKVTVDANLSVAGVSTLTGNLTLGAGIEPASDLGTTLGTASKRFSSSQIGGIRVGVAQTFEIDTISGTELVLNSSAGTTRINDDVFISGIGSFGGELTVATGLIPDESKGAYIGTSGKPFSEAFIDDLTLGVSNATEINTTSGNLRLNASSGETQVLSNLNVSGVTTVSSAASFSQNTHFVGLSTFYTGLIPNQSKGAYIGQSTKPFSEAHINEIRVGVGATNKIDTREGSLLLNGANNLVNIQNNLLVSGSSTFSGDVTFGTSGVFTIDNTLGRVGIGTTFPESKFFVNDTSTLNIDFRSQTGNVEVSLGSSAIGSGTSVGQIGYASSILFLRNEDLGGVNFITNSGNAGVGTGGFNWIYGQTSQNLMTLDYTGRLTVGDNFANQNISFGIFDPSIATVSISTITGVGNTALYVDGDVRFRGRTDIVGILSVRDGTGTPGAGGLLFDPENGTLTIQNIIVQGSTTGITAVGSGVTVQEIIGGGIINYGTNATLRFTDGLNIVSSGGGTATVGVAPVFSVGIGTTITAAVLDIVVDDQYIGASSPFVLLPRITTTLRDAYIGTEGAMIYNTTAQRYEVFLPGNNGIGTGGWCGIATIA